MIIDFHQSSQYYNILLASPLILNYVKTKLQLRKYSIFKFVLTTNIELFMKDDQASMCDLQP